MVEIVDDNAQPFAKVIKESVGDRMAVGTVGSIQTGKLANQLLEEGLDLAIAVSRQRGFFIRHSGRIMGMLTPNSV